MDILPCNDEPLLYMIGEGDACLIGEDETVYFSRRELIDRIPGSLDITSSGYMNCAEVYGKLATGESFYIHAQSEAVFDEQMSKFSELLGDDFAVDEVTIKCQFDRFVHPGETRSAVIERNKGRYDDICSKWNIPAESRAIVLSNTDHNTTVVGVETRRHLDWHMRSPEYLELSRDSVREVLVQADWPPRMADVMSH